MPIIYQDINGVEIEATNQGHTYVAFSGTKLLGAVEFQNGSIAKGVNGITSEALLAILIDRTSHLNERLPCYENEQALIHLNKALQCYNTRTRDRIDRGVQNTNDS